MARVRRDQGPVGSSARSLCQERNRPKTSLPKSQVNSRSTSSSPHTRGTGILSQHLAAQVPLEVDVRAAARVPAGLREHVQVELVGDPLGQGQEERFGRLEMSGVELLEIRQHDSAPASRACCRPRASSDVLPIWRAPLTSTMLSRRAMAMRNSSSAGRTT